MDAAAPEFDLDVIGVLEGTDKSSTVAFRWDYLRHYQALFARWRDAPINFIEIGVATGASLKVWKAYFSRATIIGLDIDPNCRRFAGDRIEIETGSQDDPGFLHQVCAKYPPTIIIDDGSHLAHHIVHSFRRLFPALLPGGIYVVEDMEFQFGRFGDWTGNKSVSAPDYFLDLARARMAYNTELDTACGDDLYIRQHIDSISFVGGAVAIAKQQPRDVALALRCAEAHLRSIDVAPEQLLRLAQYIVEHGGPLERAERAVKDAIAAGGDSPESLTWLIEVLGRLDRLEEAAEAARNATSLRPDDHAAWGWLGHLELRLGGTNQAISALERAVALCPQEAVYRAQLSHLWEHKGDLPQALAAAKSAAELSPGHADAAGRVMELEQRIGTGRAA